MTEQLQLSSRNLRNNARLEVMGYLGISGTHKSRPGETLLCSSWENGIFVFEKAVAIRPHVRFKKRGQPTMEWTPQWSEITEIGGDEDRAKDEFGRCPMGHRYLGLVLDEVAPARREIDMALTYKSYDEVIEFLTTSATED